jgi:hypothetical protein
VSEGGFLTCVALPLAVASSGCCVAALLGLLVYQQGSTQKRNLALQAYLQGAMDVLSVATGDQAETADEAALSRCGPHPQALHNSRWKCHYERSSARGRSRQVLTVEGNAVSILGEDTEDGPFTAEGVYERSAGRLLWRETYSCQPDLVTYVEAFLSKDGLRLRGQFVANTPMAPGKIDYSRVGQEPSRALLRSGLGAPDWVDEDWVEEVYDDMSEAADKDIGLTAVVPISEEDELRQAQPRVSMHSSATTASSRTDDVRKETVVSWRSSLSLQRQDSFASTGAESLERKDSISSMRSSASFQRKDSVASRRSSGSLRRSVTSVSMLFILPRVDGPNNTEIQILVSFYRFLQIFTDVDL